METRDLKYFMAIVELGSVQAAAFRVGRTQPALTKSIKRLEMEVGGKLFSREGRSIKLTPLGAEMLRHASLICRTVDSTIYELRASALGERGRVRLGISPTSAHSMLPDVIEKLVHEAPGLRYQIFTGTPGVLRGALRAREVDLIIGPEEGEDRREFKTLFLHNDDVIVASGHRHPMAGRIVKARDLCGYDWLLPTEDIHTRRWLQARLQKLNVVISVKVEASSLINMRLNVIRGNFLTFIARSDMSFGDHELLMGVECKELELRRRIVLLHLADGVLPPAATRFIEGVRAMSKSHHVRWSGQASAQPRRGSPQEP